MKLLLLLGAACLAGWLFFPSNARSADQPPRERTLFNDGWRFQKDDPAGTGEALSYGKIRGWLLASANDAGLSIKSAPRPSGEEPGAKVSYAQPGFDDSAWRQLDLPHDWGIEGPFRQELPGETGKLPWAGVGWYRKHFNVPLEMKIRRYQLQIDGAMSYSSVWCNGKFVGGWPYGYSSYQLDLTPFLKNGVENVLAIRLDNPPESSRWYPGGGLYRNVWLVKTGPVYLENWSTQITTPQIRASAAQVKIATRLADKLREKVVLTAAIYELDAAGKKSARPVATEQAPQAFQAGEAQVLAEVKNPQLWSPPSPHLYAAVVSASIGDRLVDQQEITFGFRTIEFTTDEGLQVNGRRVPIQGVCLHHDLGALGSAINPRALQRQIELLQAMGVNAIRTSHNPPAPELLDLCDRMGILVMDEFVDCWKKQKKPNGYNLLFDEWAEKDVRAMVRRDRNHPSVILWSIGNEIHEQGAPEGPALARALSSYVHAEDPTRPTAIGANNTAAGYNGFQTGVDVFGYNYKPGEYRKFHEKNPQIPLFGSETASTVSSRGEYFFPVSSNKGDGKSDFQVSSYDLYAPGWAMPPDDEFRGQDENTFVAGEFVWTGFDYLGEPTPYNDDSTNLLNYHTPEAKAAAEKELAALGKIRVPSRSSYFGILDLAGFKKDRFYLYQARWRPELPMAHLLPHWNWPERIGEVTPVHVYTSGDEAELFLNGQSLGKKTKSKTEYRLRWDDVKYKPGELKVVAYKNHQPWAEDVVKTTGPATKLLLQPDRPAIAADGLDLSYVTVTIADQDNLLVPRTKNLLKFEIEGPGEIVATDNGDATDHTLFQSTERKACNGLALAIIRLKPHATGPVTLRVTSEGLATAEVKILPAR